jgi:cell division control protein 7
VSRGGTRGYRPPEVLARYRHQSCAIDMWSAGVILLSIMTRRPVFFVSADDNDALAEIACLVGSQRLKEFAQRLGGSPDPRQSPLPLPLPLTHLHSLLCA